jgi:hypothetical protein
MNAPHGKAGAFGRRGSRASLPRWYMGIVGLALCALALLLAPGTSGASPNEVPPPKLTESFPAKWVANGGTIAMNFTLRNPNQEISFENAGFSDTLPAGLVLGNPVNATGTCLSNQEGVFTGVPGGHQLKLTNVTLSPSSSCTLSVNVKGTVGGRQVNTTGAPSAEYMQGSQQPATTTGDPAVANVIVLETPELHMDFGAPTLALHGRTTLRFRIRNPAINPVDLTGVTLTDQLPAQLRVASPPGAQNTCGGTWQADAGASKLKLSGGTIPVGSECSLTVVVVAKSEGTADNSAGPVSSDNGGVGNSAKASLIVVMPPKIAVDIKPAKVVSGKTVRVTFTITNPNSTAGLDVLVFYVRLSKKLTVANHPNVVSSCPGGTFTANPGAGTMRFRNGHLPPAAVCKLSVMLRAGGRGVKRVETTRIAARDAVPGNRAVGEVTVVAPHRHRHHH